MANNSQNALMPNAGGLYAQPADFMRRWMRFQGFLSEKEAQDEHERRAEEARMKAEALRRDLVPEQYRMG